MNMRNALIWRKNLTDHEYIWSSVLCASPNKTMRSKMSFIAFQQWRIWYLHKYHSHIIKDDTILKWCNNFLVSLRRCCGVVADVLSASSQHNHPVTRPWLVAGLILSAQTLWPTALEITSFGKDDDWWTLSIGFTRIHFPEATHSSLWILTLSDVAH